jgi:hypothetical protein
MFAILVNSLKLMDVLAMEARLIMTSRPMRNVAASVNPATTSRSLI